VILTIIDCRIDDSLDIFFSLPFFLTEVKMLSKFQNMSREERAELMDILQAQQETSDNTVASSSSSSSSVASDGGSSAEGRSRTCCTGLVSKS
jgi:hypothetical protein